MRRVQDGFDLYLHAFFATVDGHWCVVQQGMNEDLGEARRYHWQSDSLPGFFDSPHAAIEGRNVGAIVNLADIRAERSRNAGLELAHGGPERSLSILKRVSRVGQCSAVAVSGNGLHRRTAAAPAAASSSRGPRVGRDAQAITRHSRRRRRGGT